ncbi:MAG: hypothetical protein OXD47_02500 [Gammaproteobacteria bacterium]|nr:hypothetical protein [Gammaproteobacteria bacterium]MCY4281877.1 hypothetical protein [Gammaproteobacteria bacterium]MCY4337649.1 hypothetical protein [Gammaproteobacteria bacterium]
MSALNRIEMVTVACAEPGAVAHAYQRYLHYQQVGAGQVSTQLAQLWERDALAGAPYLLLAPANAAQHFVRLVRVDADPEYRPFSVAGWSAAEILVNDVDRLAHTLAGSPFTLVGPPADLSFTDKIRACQVLGPAAEALYLTQIKGDIPGFDLPRARQTVAHCFVAILATPSLAASMAYYRTRFGVAEAPVIDARITLMSAAFDLPRDHLHRLSALTLGNPGYLLEMDELPPDRAPRPRRHALLPPGIAMVSFNCSGRRRHNATVSLPEPPYHGRQVGFCTGPSGELLELIYGDL